MPLFGGINMSLSSSFFLLNPSKYRCYLWLQILLKSCCNFTQFSLQIYSILAENLLNSLNLIKCKIFEIRKLYIFTSFHPFCLLMISFICTRVEILSPLLIHFPPQQKRHFGSKTAKLPGVGKKIIEFILFCYRFFVTLHRFL